MRRLPHLDLRIAGSGPFEADLRRQAEGMANVHFEGRLDSAEVAALFRGALAVAVPSLVYETFGYVVLEAFAEKTPVVVRDLGALPELVAESGGGLVFRTQRRAGRRSRPARRRRRPPRSGSAATATSPGTGSGRRPSTSSATSA